MRKRNPRKDEGLAEGQIESVKSGSFDSKFNVLSTCISDSLWTPGKDLNICVSKSIESMSKIGIESWGVLQGQKSLCLNPKKLQEWLKTPILKFWNSGIQISRADHHSKRFDYTVKNDLPILKHLFLTISFTNCVLLTIRFTFEPWPQNELMFSGSPSYPRERVIPTKWIRVGPFRSVWSPPCNSKGKGHPTLNWGIWLSDEVIHVATNHSYPEIT